MPRPTRQAGEQTLIRNPLLKSLVVAAVAVGVPLTASAEVLFRADYETGDITQWQRKQVVSDDRVQVVDSPVAEGTKALKVTVLEGDDPIDSSGNRNEFVQMTLEPEGSESWYRWNTMFAEDYPSADTWQLFLQWHHRGNDGSPPLQFQVRGEEIKMRANKEFVWSAPLVRGQWNEFLLHVKWSSDPDEGFVELWHNGQLALPKTFTPTQYPGELNYLKMGLYRDDKIKEPGVLWHDGLVIGTELADVLKPGEAAETAAPGAGAQ